MQLLIASELPPYSSPVSIQTHARKVLRKKKYARKIKGAQETQ